MDPHIQIRNLNTHYGEGQALKNVTLDIPKHQITVIMGPSGCGKTTLLKSMNRFLELYEDARLEGEVLIDGENIYAPNVDVTEIRKKTGLLSQRPYPLPMSIYDNVAYGLRIHGLCKKGCDLNAKVRHYLETAGLWDEVKDRLHAPASGLSIGQQQRLCLARGLAIEPEIILGDEPTSALDPISAQHIEKRSDRFERPVHRCAGNTHLTPGKTFSRLRGFHVPGRSGGTRSRPRAIHQPQAGTHTGLSGRSNLIPFLLTIPA